MIHPDLEPLAVDIDTLILLPGNPNRGDVAAVKASYSAFGQRKPIVARTSDRVVEAGNTQLMAARELGLPQIAVLFVDDDDITAKAYALADNRTAELGSTDDRALADMLGAVAAAGDAALLAATAYSAADLAALLQALDPAAPKPRLTDDDALPAAPVKARTKRGDVWLLGRHRLMCGDSTSPADVKLLVDGIDEPVLVHADPPYGMGKEAQGVENDNLHRDELDEFQVAWWSAWSAVASDAASLYVWGQPADLWRLWWRHLEPAGDLLFRNEIVWFKASGIGQTTPRHNYPTATERCLFLMRGEQFIGNQNKDDYWPGYEPLRSWLAAEVAAAGWTSKDVNALTDTQMAGHWLSQSQFSPIPQRHYETLQAAAAGKAFTRRYDELFDELFPDLRAGGNEHRRDLSAQMRESRTYHDNEHDNMNDLWQYSRVVGDDRFGHATPKPVAMLERVIKTSTRPGDVLAVPFAGTGPEFIAAEHLDRVVAGMELTPGYVDVVARRWQEHTGQLPILQATGQAHDFTKEVT